MSDINRDDGVGDLTTLNEDETEFVNLVLEAGDRALEQNTFDFMIEQGVAADVFVESYHDFVMGEILESLEEKDLAYTEYQEELIHYNGRAIRNGEVQPIRWSDTGFKKVNRRYIYFTEKMTRVYKNQTQ